SERLELLDVISLGGQLDRHPRLLLSIAALSIAARITFIDWQYSAAPGSAPGARADQREGAGDGDRDRRHHQRFGERAEKSHRRSARRDDLAHHRDARDDAER